MQVGGGEERAGGEGTGSEEEARVGCFVVCVVAGEDGLFVAVAYEAEGEVACAWWGDEGLEVVALRELEWGSWCLWD